MHCYLLTLRCRDVPGIVHTVTGALLDVDGNILEKSQFTDEATGLFCLRTRFASARADVSSVASSLAEHLRGNEPTLSVRSESERVRALLMVSKQDHCLVDLLYRHRIGELPIDIPVVVSNHDDCRHLVESHGIEFRHIPVTPESKPAAEAALMDLIDEKDIDLVVLARYMQVLSAELCQQLAGRAINIHHSFLPGFKGAKPYQQAKDRGVKLIGATAHFVTSDLDEGPIIEQEVQRVTHAHTAASLVEIGRDVERIALARAVRLYAEDRIFLVGNRTVVFP